MPVGKRTLVSSPVAQAKRLVEHRGPHRVISLYVDLDPERFATPPARASQIRSLLDGAHRRVEEESGLDHDERIALRGDLKRIKTFLGSAGAPFKGARALAVFCSGRDDLFETIRLSRPVPGRVEIAAGPYIEPMLAAVERRRWLVALVTRSSARLLAGSPDRLSERARLEDNVHGQHDQGGWSQANYERSVEKDVADHLRHVADLVNRRWRAERFNRLALGGPQEIVPRFEALLAEEARSHQAPGRVQIDLSHATEADVRQAVERLVAEDEQEVEAKALERLAAGVGAGGRGVRGLSQTLQALNERRVETLLVEPGFDGEGERCPTCGLLAVDADGSCPADGTSLQAVPHLREAVVEVALLQDAVVLVIHHHQEFSGIGAILRF